MTSPSKKLIVLGSAGHAQVIIHGLRLQGIEIHGIIDPKLPVNETVLDIRVLGNDEVLDHITPQEYDIAVGIGMLPGNTVRRTVSKMIRDKGFEPITFVHPTAILSSTVELGSGVQVMAGSVVQNGVRLGDDVVVNTGTVIDHGSVAGSGSWISPGVTICGGVTMGQDCYVGAGATIIQNISIEEGTLVHAGKTIIKNIGIMPDRQI